MKALFLLLVFSVGTLVYAQENENCSKLGAWVWYLDLTGFENHQELADSLVSTGVKRVYIKVADGTNTTNWPEISNPTVVNIYKTRGIEVFAWSYNYPGNESQQAEAINIAANTGYQGFVIDVESEFDGVAPGLNSLFAAFAQNREQLASEGVIDDEFKLYCTTWGNPKAHNFYISIIDPHVDGYLAQTYVEQWGQSYVDNLEYWINKGDEEYVEMGATKPVHHILAIQDGNVPADRVDAFFETAGPESSIWRVPGGGVSEDIWEVWQDVSWEMDFCDATSVDYEQESNYRFYPNPVQDYLIIDFEEQDASLEMHVYNMQGVQVISMTVENEERMDFSALPSGIYIIKVFDGTSYSQSLISKM